MLACFPVLRAQHGDYATLLAASLHNVYYKSIRLLKSRQGDDTFLHKLVVCVIMESVNSGD